MKSLRIVSAIVLAVFVAGAAMASNPKCPKCKMEYSSKKDKMHSVAVKVGNKTYYCCAACGAHKAAPPAPKKKG